MNIYSTFHDKTKSFLDAARDINAKHAVPTDGRYLYVHATINSSDIAGADPEDLLVPGLYQVFVPDDLEDSMAARCAFEAFKEIVPIDNLDAIKLAVVDPETGEEIDIADDPEVYEMGLGDRCLGIEQYVAMTYLTIPKPYRIMNLYR